MTIQKFAAIIKIPALAHRLALSRIDQYQLIAQSLRDDAERRGRTNLAGADHNNLITVHGNHRDVPFPKIKDKQKRRPMVFTMNRRRTRMTQIRPNLLSNPRAMMIATQSSAIITVQRFRFFSATPEVPAF